MCASRSRDSFKTNHFLLLLRGWSPQLVLDRGNVTYRLTSNSCSRQTKLQRRWIRAITNTNRTSTSGTIHHWMFLFESFDLHCSLRMWDVHKKDTHTHSKTIGPSQKKKRQLPSHLPCVWKKVQTLDLFFLLRATKKNPIYWQRNIGSKAMLAYVTTSSQNARKLRTFAYQILGLPCDSM